ncbi:hypothetical protein OAM01_00410 [bacterium]|nr:hypothetical protein [bacterium]
MPPSKTTAKAMLNPILKKELHLLKGPIIAGAGLMVLIWGNHAWVSPYLLPSTFWSVGLLAFLLSHITTSAFGHEISGRFFGGWISQPHTRKKLWFQKLAPTLTVYFGIGFVLSISSIWIEAARPDHFKNTQLLSILPCILVACFGPGIFYNLKFRNPVASFWLTVISIPLLFVGIEWIGTIILPINQHTTEGFFTGLQLWVWGFFLAYGAWGFIAARRLFLRWEDVGNEGKALELRFRKNRTKERPNKIKFPFKQAPLRTYILNELRIQQLNILIGILMVGAMWGTHYWSLHHNESSSPHDDIQKMISELPNMFRYMLYILPCSIAALAIADHRRQDVHTWELMLPLSRRFKWAIKLIICLFLGWLFSAGLPWSYDSKNLFSTVKPETKTITLYVLSIAAIVISSLSFYISSLTSSFLKSFSFSLGLIPLMAFFLGFVELLYREEQGSHIHNGFFAVPTGVILLLSLCALWWSRTNFATPLIFKQHRTLNWKRWGWSMMVIVLWIGIMVDRSWERFTLSESPSSKKLGVGRVKSADTWQKKHIFKSIKSYGPFEHIFTVTPFLGEMRGGRTFIITSSGRSHMIQSRLVAGKFWPSHSISTPKNIQLNTPLACEVEHALNRFYLLDTNGTIWTTAAHDYRSEDIKFFPYSPEGIRFRALQCSSGTVAAIDGSNHLWVAEAKIENNKYTGVISDFEKIQHNHTWKDIWSRGRSIIGLKDDGSLWVIRGRYSPMVMMQGSDDWDGEMTRIASDRLWKSMNWKKNYVLLEAEDGSLWTDRTTFEFSFNGSSKHFWSKDQTLIKLQIPDLHQLETSLAHPTGEGYYFIKDDGTLWKGKGSFENLPTSQGETSNQPPIFSIHKAKQIGKRDDWVSLYLYAGMTADGKIWNWDQPQLNRWNPFPARFRHKMVAELSP